MNDGAPVDGSPPGFRAWSSVAEHTDPTRTPACSTGVVTVADQVTRSEGRPRTDTRSSRGTLVARHQAGGRTADLPLSTVTSVYTRSTVLVTPTDAVCPAATPPSGAYVGSPTRTTVPQPVGVQRVLGDRAARGRRHPFVGRREERDIGLDCRGRPSRVKRRSTVAAPGTQTHTPPNWAPGTRPPSGSTTDFVSCRPPHSRMTVLVTVLDAVPPAATAPAFRRSVGPTRRAVGQPGPARSRPRSPCRRTPRSRSGTVNVLGRVGVIDHAPVTGASVP